MTIKFEKIVQESKLLNPLNNFQLDTQVIEYRVDPLTKETTLLNVTAVERGIKFPITLDEAWLKQTIESVCSQRKWDNRAFGNTRRLRALSGFSGNAVIAHSFS